MDVGDHEVGTDAVDEREQLASPASPATRTFVGEQARCRNGSMWRRRRRRCDTPGIAEPPTALVQRQRFASS
jgi:hypothetical protein